MERMFSMICSMICWPRMVHWFVRFIGQSFGGTTNFSSSLKQCAGYFTPDGLPQGLQRRGVA